MKFSFWIFLLLIIVPFFESNAQENDSFNTNIYCEFEDPIERFACMADHAAKGIKSFLDWTALSRDEIAAFKAIEAMNLVQIIAGSGRYAYLQSTQRDFSVSSMSQQADLLNKGYGICANHQYLFIEILRRIGLEARPVDFFYLTEKGERKNHAAAEVKINNKWIYFDVTWGSFWLGTANDLSTLMSLEDIRQGKGIRVGGNGNSWYLYCTHKSRHSELRDPFNYLYAKNLHILRNKGGVITIIFKYGVFDFTDIPNYFGKSEGNDPLKIRLEGDFKPSEAVLEISGVGGVCKESVIRIGSNTYPVVAGKTKILVEPNSMLEVEGRDEICYAVISNLKLIHNAKPKVSQIQKDFSGSGKIFSKINKILGAVLDK